MNYFICLYFTRDVRIGGATGARAPLNVLVGVSKLTKLVRLDN